MNLEPSSQIHSEKNRICWWEKGGSVEKNQSHYKCYGYGKADGCTGAGDTLEQALNDLLQQLDLFFSLD